MVDLDKFIISMINSQKRSGYKPDFHWLGMAMIEALKDQGLEYKDSVLVPIEKPDTIKFEPDIDNKMPLKESKQANHAISSYHPRKFHPQTQGVLRLDEGNQSIVVERLLIELVEYIRSGIYGLEESKVLPFLDSLQRSLEEQEKQHWTHVLGFPVPEGMKFLQVP